MVFGIFFTGAFLCLFSSAVFHLMCSHSYEVSLALNRCDYAGITLMIVGSTFPLVYFAFNCEWALQVGYLSFITACGIFTMPFIMMERFSTPKCVPPAQPARITALPPSYPALPTLRSSAPTPGLPALPRSDPACRRRPNR